MAGHSAIMINNEYYDFGPQPGEPFLSEGRPWWDAMSNNGNLKKNDIITILENTKYRKDWEIFGEVNLINIEISEKENKKIEEWWISKYKEPGNYSIIPILGEQCTTNVKKSITETTNVINTNVFVNIADKVQTPKGLLELLTNLATHTYGKKRNTTLTVSKKYNEIKIP